MDKMQELVDHYLPRLRQGRTYGDAFDSLVEAGPAIVPLLQAAADSEPDAEMRATLVELVWELRSPDSLEFLARCLYDPSPLVWKAALDGLVTVGSTAAAEVLETALNRPPEKRSAEYEEWVKEALDQVREQMEAES